IRLPMNNTGTVEVQTGTLNLIINSRRPDTIKKRDWSTVECGSDIHTLSAGSSISAPNATVNLNTTETFAGGYNVGTTNMASGTATFNMSSVSFAVLNLSGGTLTGSANFGFSSGSTLNWSNGIMSGGGV